MANTYTQIYIQTVFAVEGRQSLISTDHKDELYKYISGIVRNEKQKLMAINGVSDHIHILIGMDPDIALSNLVKTIKVASSRFMNDKRWVKGRFRWQSGFGAFSYSRSQVSRVATYIENQERHHQRKSFRDEYTGFLKKFEVEYDPRYLFNFMDDLSI
ncbi:MAG TPA: IS200/IS605 family transposase [Blastocatellia bacterium]|nr:IS200/IS605 family transposase [Blastocatellia bacterium]